MGTEPSNVALRLLDEVVPVLEVQGFLGRTMQGAQSSEEKELFRVATAALMFISETGTVHPFEDYLQFRREAPPYAVASFKTREEADSWLRQHPEPPHGAFVLIADEYHIVMHVREMNHRIPYTCSPSRGPAARGEDDASQAKLANDIAERRQPRR